MKTFTKSIIILYHTAFSILNVTCSRNTKFIIKTRFYSLISHINERYYYNYDAFYKSKEGNNLKSLCLFIESYRMACKQEYENRHISYKLNDLLNTLYKFYYEFSKRNKLLNDLRDNLESIYFPNNINLNNLDSDEIFMIGFFSFMEKFIVFEEEYCDDNHVQIRQELFNCKNILKMAILKVFNIDKDIKKGIEDIYEEIEEIFNYIYLIKPFFYDDACLLVAMKAKLNMIQKYLDSVIEGVPLVAVTKAIATMLLDVKLKFYSELKISSDIKSVDVIRVNEIKNKIKTIDDKIDNMIIDNNTLFLEELIDCIRIDLDAYYEKMTKDIKLVQLKKRNEYEAHQIIKKIKRNIENISKVFKQYEKYLEKIPSLKKECEKLTNKLKKYNQEANDVLNNFDRFFTLRNEIEKMSFIKIGKIILSVGYKNSEDFENSILYFNMKYILESFKINKICFESYKYKDLELKTNIFIQYEIFIEAIDKFITTFPHQKKLLGKMVVSFENLLICIVFLSDKKLVSANSIFIDTCGGNCCLNDVVMDPVDFRKSINIQKKITKLLKIMDENKAIRTNEIFMIYYENFLKLLVATVSEAYKIFKKIEIDLEHSLSAINQSKQLIQQISQIKLKDKETFANKDYYIDNINKEEEILKEIKNFLEERTPFHRFFNLIKYAIRAEKSLFNVNIIYFELLEVRTDLNIDLIYNESKKSEDFLIECIEEEIFICNLIVQMLNEKTFESIKDENELQLLKNKINYEITLNENALRGINSFFYSNSKRRLFQLLKKEVKKNKAVKLMLTNIVFSYKKPFLCNDDTKKYKENIYEDIILLQSSYFTMKILKENIENSNFLILKRDFNKLKKELIIQRPFVDAFKKIYENISLPIKDEDSCGLELFIKLLIDRNKALIKKFGN